MVCRSACAKNGRSDLGIACRPNLNQPSASTSGRIWVFRWLRADKQAVRYGGEVLRKMQNAPLTSKLLGCNAHYQRYESGTNSRLMWLLIVSTRRHLPRIPPEMPHSQRPLVLASRLVGLFEEVSKRGVRLLRLNHIPVLSESTPSAA